MEESHLHRQLTIPEMIWPEIDPPAMRMVADLPSHHLRSEHLHMTGEFGMDDAKFMLNQIVVNGALFGYLAVYGQGRTYGREFSVFKECAHQPSGGLVQKKFDQHEKLKAFDFVRVLLITRLDREVDISYAIEVMLSDIEDWKWSQG